MMAKNKKPVTSEETQETVISKETQAETVTPEEGTQEKGTTETLFPEMEQEDGPDDLSEATEEVVEEEVAKEEPPMIQVEGMGEVSMEDLIKNFQTSKQLGDARNALAEEKAEIKELKEVMQKSLAQAKQPDSTPEETSNDWIDDKAHSEVDKLKQEMEELKASVGQVNSATADVQYKQTLSIVENNLKSESDAFDDFMDYEPKIREMVEAMPAAQKEANWTIEGFQQLYKDLKLKDILSGKKKEAKPKVDERATAKVIPIESSGSKPSGVDDSASTYQAAFEKAQSSGRVEDWSEVMRLKGARGY
jgi:hypothetical protein